MKLLPCQPLSPRVRRASLMLVVALFALTACALSGQDRRDGQSPSQFVATDSKEKVYGKTPGIFRHRWWNYFDRGLSFAEGRMWAEAERDFREATAQRAEDQRRARTYGMHFTDYFARRELGVVLYHQGRFQEALVELEGSLASEKSSKAEYYLDLARKAVLQASGVAGAPPAITLADVSAAQQVTRAFQVPVSGLVTADTYVKEVRVDGKPVRVDVAAKKVAFETTAALRPGPNRVRVTATSLLGKETETTLSYYLDVRGPVLSLDWTTSGAGLRVKAHVTDDVAVAEVKINEALVYRGQAGECDVDQILAAAPPEGVVVEARDTVGNVTKTIINPAARAALPAPFMVAMASGAGIFLPVAVAGVQATSPGGPKLVLKNLSEGQSCYANQFFIEGGVEDEIAVASLTLNGEPILKRPGKKVSFSYLADLKEGENLFSIVAQAQSGNKTEKSFTIHRKLQKAFAVDARASIALLPFERKGEQTAVTAALEDAFISTIGKMKRFHIVERQKLESVLREQSLSNTALADSATAIKIGKIMAAENVLMGSVNEADKAVELYGRLVDTESSLVLATVDAYGEDVTLQSLNELVTGLLLKFGDEIPLTQGYVVKVKDREVYINIGQSQKIKNGMRFIVYREGEPIVDPVTKESLGADTDILGRAVITQVLEKMSVGTLYDGSQTVIDTKCQVVTR